MHRPRSGSLLVLGMVAFGLTLTGGLYGYWTARVGPFRPLTESLNKAYPRSSPRVEGGRPPGDRTNAALTLRIVMKPGFDPNAEPDRAETYAREVATLAAERLAADPDQAGRFARIEVHLFRGEPERGVSQRTTRWRIVAGDGMGQTASVRPDLPPAAADRPHE